MKKTMLSVVKMLGLSLAFVSSLSFAMSTSSENIVQNAIKAHDLSTLVTAVKAADLVATLEGKGPFTVFAPTNEAFAKLPAGTLDNLLKPENKAKLADILKYHVVAGKVMAADIKDGQVVKTVEGQNITLTVKDGKVMINNSAEVVKADIAANNGVIHVINAVLLPAAK